MYTLYYKPTCPYCIKVTDFAKEHDISLSLKDINVDSVAEELIARGGKRMVPYLVDEEAGKEMYESSDIIAYITLKEL